MRVRLTILLGALVAFFVSVSPAVAAPAQVGPVDVTGQIDGAPFRIIVPAAWNGKLIVFAHGYDDKADHPGEVDVRGPFQGGTGPTLATLLGQGWAVAGTAYKDNGWVVKDGLEDVVALASHFKDTIANPARTYLWGFSMGSVVTLETAERNGGAFDGYIAACAIGAGTPRGADGLLSLMLAYDTAFGAPASWGALGDVRDDLDFETEVVPVMLPQIFNPANFARFEFIRLVAGTPGQGVAMPSTQFPGWIFDDFYFATEATAEMERRAGGHFMQNLTHTYSLTPSEKAYLAVLGIDADPLLAAMNARRTIEAEPSARNYVEHYAGFSGKIKNPVITMHTMVDRLVPVSHESAYAQTVERAERSDLLFQAYTTGVGHCNFSVAQNVAALTALDDWVASGERPTTDEFPADLGFDQTFVPPAWLQP